MDCSKAQVIVSKSSVADIHTIINKVFTFISRKTNKPFFKNKILTSRNIQNC